MECLTDIYNDILENNIELLNYKIIGSPGATIRIDDNYGIFIDYGRFDTLGDEFNYVVHEYSHCMTGTTHYVYSPLESKIKNEYIANKYAVNKFLPFKKIQEAIKKGYTDFQDIADYFNLTYEFVELAYTIYKKEGKI